MAGDSYSICRDLSDVKPFFSLKGLYLKPLVKINVSVQLPKIKVKEYVISNHKLIEAIKQLALPDEFCCIKSTKNTVDLVRLEAEVEESKNVRWILSRIDGQPIELKGHADCGRARASVAKNDFPSRHDWDSFFRDAKQMNEMKMGERPDTIHIRDVPKEWFVTSSSHGLPDENLLRRIFEQFGAISALDVPSNDPYRSQMKEHISGMRQFNFSTTNLFEIYVQFRDYLSFVEAMEALRGMKLLKKDGNKAWTQVIKVDFDKTKHLSENSIRKRKLLREKLMNKERQNEEKFYCSVDTVAESKVTSERPEKPDASETTNQSEVTLKKILREEKLFLAAQRKLESIRLLSVLLERISDKKTIPRNSSSEKRPKKKSEVATNSQAIAENVQFLEDHDDLFPIRTYDNNQRYSSRGMRYNVGHRGRGRFTRGYNNYRGWRRYNQSNCSHQHYRYHSRDNNYFDRQKESRYHYDKTVQSLYCRYFESLTRDKDKAPNDPTNSSLCRSASKSRSRSRSHSREKNRSTPQRQSKSKESSTRSHRRRSRSYSRRRSKSNSHSSHRDKSRSHSQGRQHNSSKSLSRRRKESNSRSHRRNRSSSHFTLSD